MNHFKRNSVLFLASVLAGIQIAEYIREDNYIGVVILALLVIVANIFYLPSDN